MNIESSIFLAIFLGANAFFAYKVFILYRLAKATHGPVWSGNRFDRIPERIATFISNVLGQKAVLEKKNAGIMHFFIFWGFIIITIGTIELFLYEIHPGFSFEFIGSAFYATLVALQDTFMALVFGAVLYAFYRRRIIRPKGLEQSYDAYLILSLITALMVTLLGMNAFRMIADPKWFDSALWVSTFFRHFIEPLTFSPETASFISALFRWLHLGIVLAFLMYIPSSKHLHILAAAPNTFLRTLDVPKPMHKINLEDENATSFGLGKITEMSWKDTLDLYACTECGRCQDVCPAWNTQKPLSPKRVVLDLKDILLHNRNAVLKNKVEEIAPVLGNKITDDVIWACTTCRACEEACPVFIEQTDKIYETRRNMVLMQGRFPQELQAMFKSVETNFSPWAMSPDDRSKWADGLEIKTMEEVMMSQEPIEYLYWVGCAASFDDRNKKVARAVVSLLKKANVKFAILGNKEKCTGDPVRRVGNEYLAQTLIQENVNTLNQYQVKKVITACPHCFNAIKNEWKQFGGNFEVFHHTQLISKLLQEGRLKPTKDLGDKITYHDSCYIGRWNNEYQAPRNILNALPNAKIQEMEQRGPKGMCCGAGGGRMWMEEKIGTRVNIARTEQALETGANIVASNCPFCMTMLTDGVKAKGVAEKVKVMDLAELVDQATG